MKCPKCGYLGYEQVDRCRNCGYDFSLNTSTVTPPELHLRDSNVRPQPFDDLDLADGTTAPGSTDRFHETAAKTAAPSDLGLVELPLFGPPIADDVPLITRPSPPRTPLSVRRATPEVPRLRAEPRAPLLDWNDPVTAPKTPAPRPRHQTATEDAAGQGQRGPAARAAAPAGFRARALATLIDVGLLAVVDIVVVYFTLKICRLGLAELSLLPRAPLLTFLLLQNAGYVIAFTTTGQTLGKMIAGVRVLSDDSEHAPDVGRSTLRAMVWLLLALPAGLGLLTATFSRDGRGLHDRFAGTRVVSAGA